ncbi:unnamed protein product [Pleuronectes platessa]|uniref:Uncharacterized protein n=1 Tax=Pleuronectes platessa TaxID=8262 RepID=A0A9N7VTT2_PLEPL|nr:unnamed protein product [Pleuronectes platessa]
MKKTQQSGFRRKQIDQVRFAVNSCSGPTCDVREAVRSRIETPACGGGDGEDAGARAAPGRSPHSLVSFLLRAAECPVASSIKSSRIALVLSKKTASLRCRRCERLDDPIPTLGGASGNAMPGPNMTDSAKEATFSQPQPTRRSLNLE